MDIPEDLDDIKERLSELKTIHNDDIDKLLDELEKIKVVEPTTLEKVFVYNQQLADIKEIVYDILALALPFVEFKKLQDITISKWKVNPLDVKYGTAEEVFTVWKTKKQGVYALKAILQYILNNDYEKNIYDMMQIVDEAKSIMLKQDKVISPYLSLNLFVKKPIQRESIDTKKYNYVILHRDHKDNNYYKLPNTCIIDTNIGITPSVVQQKFFTLPDVKKPKVEIEFIETKGKKYNIIEEKNGFMHQLNTEPVDLDDKTNYVSLLIRKIKEKDFGRPEAYNKNIEASLLPYINTSKIKKEIDNSVFLDIGDRISKLEHKKILKSAIGQSIYEILLDSGYLPDMCMFLSYAFSDEYIDFLYREEVMSKLRNESILPLHIIIQLLEKNKSILYLAKRLTAGIEEADDW